MASHSALTATQLPSHPLIPICDTVVCIIQYQCVTKENLLLLSQKHKLLVLKTYVVDIQMNCSFRHTQHNWAMT